MKVSKKKLAVVAGTSAVAIAGAGVAYAYVSGGTGSDTENATTATADSLSKDLTVTVTPPTGLVPGADASAVGVSVQNTGLSYSVHFKTLTVSLGTLPEGCDASWITLGGTKVFNNSGNGFTIAPSTTDSTDFVGATLKMEDSSSDQAACFGQNIPVTATLSNS